MRRLPPALNWEAAMRQALSLPGQGHPTAEAGDDGLATLMSREGTNSRNGYAVQKPAAEPASQANEWVVGQLLHDDRIGPLKEAYSSLTQNVAKIEDLRDNLFLTGKPAGTCFLCPKDSIV